MSSSDLSQDLSVSNAESNSHVRLYVSTDGQIAVRVSVPKAEWWGSKKHNKKRMHMVSEHPSK